MAQRIASAIVAAAIGLIIALMMTFWIAVPAWAFAAVPLMCALAGFAAGDRVIDVLKHICSWM